MPELTKGILQKAAADTVPFVFDFGEIPELQAGQTITGTPTVTGSPSGLTITGIAVAANGYQVGFTVAGGTNGTDYTLTCGIVLSGGAIISRQGTLEVQV